MKPTMTRRIAGSKAAKNGASFENLFEDACGSIGLGCTRVPNGCRQVGVDRFGRPRLIRVASPWDWVVTHGNTSAFLDTKTTTAASFQFSKIDENQVKEMMKHARAGGNVAGYVVWIKGVSKVVFIPVALLNLYLGSRGSFKYCDPGVIELGSLVDQPRSGAINFRFIFGDVFRRGPNSCSCASEKIEEKK